MILDLPPSGALIRLTTAPVGSYATAGDVYRVTYAPTRRQGKRVIHGQTTIRLWDETRQCGTYDSAIMWNVHGRKAQWEIIAE